MLFLRKVGQILLDPHSKYVVVIDLQCISKHCNNYKTLEVRHAWKSTLPRNKENYFPGQVASQRRVTSPHHNYDFSKFRLLLSILMS